MKSNAKRDNLEKKKKGATKQSKKKENG